MTRTIGATLFALSLVVPAPAQGPRVHYTAKPQFVLPVKLSDADRQQMQEIRFYAKLAPGGWELKETAPPTQERFGFTAPRDGEYWFQFVLMDRAGRSSVANLDKTPPAMVVVVDTVPPEVSVQAIPVVSGETLLQCKLRDSYPDYRSVQLEWRDATGTYRPLEPVAESPGLFRVTDSAALTGTVRATANDKAGNRVVKEVALGQPALAAAPAQTAEPPIVVVPPSMRPVEPPPAVQPVSAVSQPQTTMKPAEPASLPPARKLLNTAHCALDFSLEAVGPGGVQRIEAYVTKDDGKTWKRYAECVDRKSPFEFELPGDGEYGIALVVSAGNVAGVTPGKGDVPDWVVEVDTAAPSITLHNLAVEGDGANSMVVLNWTAKDKNLTPDGVELSRSPSPDGPWQQIAGNLKANGQYRWPLPRDVQGRLYFKLDASDKAGNVASLISPQPLVIEAPRPKARVIGISPLPRQ